MARLRAKLLSALRDERVVRLRDALEVLWSEAGVHATQEGLTAHLQTTELGIAALQCCNADSTVVRDHYKQPHDATSLADELLRITERLNTDAQGYRDAGDALELKSTGLSESQVHILRCLFDAHEFPVRVLSAADDEATGA